MGPMQALENEEGGAAELGGGADDRDQQRMPDDLHSRGTGIDRRQTCRELRRQLDGQSDACGS